MATRGFRAIRRTNQFRVGRIVYTDCGCRHGTAEEARKCDPGADWIECPHGRDAATCHECYAERRR